MSWAGILHVSNNIFYMNAKKIADSQITLINYFYFFKAPRLIIVYIKNKEQGKKIKKLTKIFKKTNVIIYKKIATFVYVPNNKFQYLICICIGFILSFLICCILVLYALDVQESSLREGGRVNYQDTVSWINKICNNKPCVKKVSIFPKDIWIEFKENKKNPAHCIKKRGNIFQCKKDALFMAY